MGHSSDKDPQSEGANHPTRIMGSLPAQQELLTPDQFIEYIRSYHLVAELDCLDTKKVASSNTASEIAEQLIQSGSLSSYQAECLLNGNGDALRLSDYVILEVLGKGGMGQVYLARHIQMDRLVAVKVLAEGRLNSEEDVLRFRREIKVLGKLTHPNIVAAYDARQNEQTFFLVMEYVPGRDLATLVKEAGPVSLQSTLPMIRQAAAGLSYAHQNGIVHRDVKPANLMLDDSGTVRVLDLGLARAFDRSESNENHTTDLTAAGVALGTLAYMAPEQAFATENVGPAADVYGLGCTLFFLLTGRPPVLPSEKAKYILGRDNVRPAQLGEFLPNAPDRIERLLDSMLQIDPLQRMQSMESVINEIDAITQSLLKDASFIPVIAPEPNLSKADAVYQSTASMAGVNSDKVTIPSPVDSIEKASKNPVWIALTIVLIVAASVVLGLQGISSIQHYIAGKSSEPLSIPTDQNPRTTDDVNAVSGETTEERRNRVHRGEIRPLNWRLGKADLLRWFDLTKDVSKGEIRFENRALLLPSNAWINVRAELPQHYRLELELQRVPETDGAFRPVILSGTVLFGMVIDSPSEVIGYRLCGINPYGGEGLFQAQDIKSKGALITSKKVHTLFFEIDTTGVNVSIDGKEVYQWSGNFDSLTTRLPPESTYSLAFTTNSDAEQFLIHRAEIIDLSLETK